MYYVLQVLLAEDLAVTSDCSCLRVWTLPCATTIATFNTQVREVDTKDQTDNKRDNANTKSQINPKD